MRRSPSLILLLGVLSSGAPARADGDRLCASLGNAWRAVKRDVSATAGHGISGSSRCETSARRLTCVWSFADPPRARDGFAEMSGVAASCLSKLGLVPRRTTVGGVETTLLKAASDDPDVAVLYAGGREVMVAIIAAD